MNIIFLTTLNPNNINTWSGTSYHVFKTLSKNHNVRLIGENIISQFSYYSQNNFPNKRSIERYSLVLGNLCTERINNFSNYDIVFFGDLYLVPFLKVGIPIVHLSDVTFQLFEEYLGHKDIEGLKRIEKLEKMVLDKYTAIIYCSEWVKQNAVNYYNVDPDKIHVVEFGANIPNPINYQINIDTNVCNLVFIGKNWKKKGGYKILHAYKKLKTGGFPCTLTIIGSVPNTLQEEDRDLTIIPFLDKSKSACLEQMCNILYKAHFLVLPTEYDAFGIVFCEASAYAVPSITSNVCGVGQVIREGKNGYLLSSESSAEDYAEKIESVFNDKDNYIRLRASSRKEFETRLNWNKWGERVNEILGNVVTDYKKINEKVEF